MKDAAATRKGYFLKNQEMIGFFKAYVRISLEPFRHLALKELEAITNLLRKFTERAETHSAYLLLEGVGVKNVGSIPTWTSNSELEALLKLGLSSPRNSIAIEVGSYLGASTCYLVAGLAKVDGRLFCVDTWQNETMPEGSCDTYSEFLSNTSSLTPWITIVHKKSCHVCQDDISGFVDLIFLDGDHSYPAVKEDFLHFSEWLADDGIIIFHDSKYFSGVIRTIGEALATGNWVIAGNLDNLCWLKRVFDLK